MKVAKYWTVIRRKERMGAQRSVRGVKRIVLNLDIAKRKVDAG
jgi:hypothetical protein